MHEHFNVKQYIGEGAFHVDYFVGGISGLTTSAKELHGCQEYILGKVDEGDSVIKIDSVLEDGDSIWRSLTLVPREDIELLVEVLNEEINRFEVGERGFDSLS